MGFFAKQIKKTLILIYPKLLIVDIGKLMYFLAH